LLEIEPKDASLLVDYGQPGNQAFQVFGVRPGGERISLTRDITWTATQFAIGAVDGAGLYTASGAQGGVVDVRATYRGKVATAKLTVKLKITEIAATVDISAQTALRNATAQDSAVRWLYPYDKTVFPRGLAAPLLMWNGGAANDMYLVHLKSATFELEQFVRPTLPVRVALPEATWNAFVESTSGGAELKVTRLSGANATVVINHRWTVAPASMRGTIYYWANNTGRVMRLKPGASQPDDFSDGKLTGLPSSNCTMTCHVVSADGSRLISGGDTLGGAYDLRGDRAVFDEGGNPGSGRKRRWAYAGISPDGKYLVESFAPNPIGFGTETGLFELGSAGVTKVASSGLDGKRLGTPSFSPDGRLIAYVDYQNGPTKDSIKLLDFDSKTAKATNDRVLVPKGAGAFPAYPSLSPDGKWVLYQRGSGHRTDQNNTADLFLASTETGQEVPLRLVNGDDYLTARDLRWNFEATFAPVPAGGYFWIVLTSRRTYGNLYTGAANQVKQLWVAAIDQTPTPGQDPSHPAFLLPGQANTLNLRGYWALDPCKGDGEGCATGSECCGGFCDGSGGGGAKVCRSQRTSCAQNGDRCEQSSDCCGVGSGVTCINHVCAEPTPR
jgi:hypothetical protein